MQFKNRKRILTKCSVNMHANEKKKKGIYYINTPTFTLLNTPKFGKKTIYLTSILYPTGLASKTKRRETVTNALLESDINRLQRADNSSNHKIRSVYRRNKSL